MEEDLATRPEQIDPSAYIAEGAVVLGDVTLEAESSVWFNAVLRGDCAPIRVGARTNVQDGCVLHADYGFPCTIGEGVTIGHGAIVHGATLEENVLVGMNAVVQNGAVVGANSIVGVGAIVKQGMQVPPGSLVIGVPGKVRRQTSEQEVQVSQLAAAHYVENARAYAQQGIGMLGEDIAEQLSSVFEMPDEFDDGEFDDGAGADEQMAMMLRRTLGGLVGDTEDSDTEDSEPGGGGASLLDPFDHMLESDEEFDFRRLGAALSQSLQGMHLPRRNLLRSCRSHGLRPRRFRNRGRNRS
jgi:carbonic anhydrase/acetyltransferase-like protein (isoleucine patch superfamily)